MRRLVQLSLVSHPESRSSLPYLTPEPADNKVETRSVSPDEEEIDVSAAQFAFGINLPPAVVPDTNAGPSGMASLDESFPERSNPLQLLPTGNSRPLTPQLSRALRDVITPTRLQRPLPETPKAESRRSSHSSLRSNCPSLTPSLAQYVDNGEFGTDDISIGLAHTVLPAAPSMVSFSALRGKAGEKEDGSSLFKPENSKGKNVELDDQGENSSSSDYENSPVSSGSLEMAVDLPSPCHYLSTTGSVLERHIAQISSPVAQPCSKFPVSASESVLSREPSAVGFGTLRLSESEWIRHTPSPVQRRSFLRMWSPRVEKKSPKHVAEDSCQQKRHRYVDRRYSHDVTGRDAVGSTARTGDKGRQTSPGAGTIPYHGPQQEQQEDSRAHSACRHGSLEAAAAEKRSTWKSCRDTRNHVRATEEYPADNWI